MLLSPAVAVAPKPSYQLGYLAVPSCSPRGYNQEIEDCVRERLNSRIVIADSSLKHVSRRSLGLGSIFLVAPGSNLKKLLMTVDDQTNLETKEDQLPIPSRDQGSKRDHGTKRNNGVPVYVMLPLESTELRKSQTGMWALSASLLALKNAGVEGVMMDVWWGIVEKSEPQQYDWSAYDELIDLVCSHGLKIQAVMSMHQCGGNVGDGTYIPLPDWVLAEAEDNPDIFYTDKSGWRNPEYISLGCDLEPVLPGHRKNRRSPVLAYADFFQAFKDHFSHLFGDFIVEIQIGLGPCGELRYPSYPQSKNQWTFPGIGEFQCYDKYLIASLKEAADTVGEAEWGRVPNDAGTYDQSPDETTFFKDDGTWKTPSGKFFLSWYSDQLIAHGERILKYAKEIFRDTPARLSVKVSGVHWLYRTASHAAELGVGYYNITEGPMMKDAYLALAQMLAKYDAIFNFTCLEMTDANQPAEAMSSPESLVQQVVAATMKAGVLLSGENALSCFDESSFAQIAHQSTLKFGPKKSRLTAFTYLRLSESLFQSKNWAAFVSFVRDMGADPVEYSLIKAPKEQDITLLPANL